MRLLLIISIFTISSCSLIESDYDKLINPIKKIKAEEKKRGITNPTFDGVVEPDFPDEVENDKTLEGVDSNKNGVRDDIEIWINRTAEDKFLRLALKEYHRSMNDLYYVVQSDQPEEVRIKKWNHWSSITLCVMRAANRFNHEYIKKSKNDASTFYLDSFSELYLNSKLRRSINSKFNRLNESGTIGENDNVIIEKCNRIFGSNEIMK